MAADPNARRDKALETIARELTEVNRHLKRIAENGRSFKFTNRPERPDPFDVPQVEQVDIPAPAPEPEPHVHPYLRRSLPDE